MKTRPWHLIQRFQVTHDLARQFIAVLETSHGELRAALHKGDQRQLDAWMHCRCLSVRDYLADMVSLRGLRTRNLVDDLQKAFGEYERAANDRIQYALAGEVGKETDEAYLRVRGTAARLRDITSGITLRGVAAGFMRFLVLPALVSAGISYVAFQRQIAKEVTEQQVMRNLGLPAECNSDESGAGIHPSGSGSPRTRCLVWRFETWRYMHGLQVQAYPTSKQVDLMDAKMIIEDPEGGVVVDPGPLKGRGLLARACFMPKGSRLRFIVWLEAGGDSRVPAQVVAMVESQDQSDCDDLFLK